MRLAQGMSDYSAALEKASGYVAPRSGSSLAQAVQAIYGQDRTFAVPILMNCALAGLVAWEAIPGLPFELAALPATTYKLLRLHVVSYALPALIAIGLLIDRRHPSPKSPCCASSGQGCGAVSSRSLGKFSPTSGGFLEATPLTSFVAMGLIPLFGPAQPVAAKCLGFLRKSQRADGSWPIDTNLSVWLTTRRGGRTGVGQ